MEKGAENRGSIKDILKPVSYFLAIILAGFVLFGLSDTSISIADTSVPDDEATSGLSKASNSSASGTITMTGVLDE